MTFNPKIKRIGFACKWAEINKKGEIASTEGLNTGGTTKAWAERQSRRVAEEKVLDVAARNIMNTHNLIKRVATLPHELRMVRLTSDMLSFYTMDDWQPFWQSTDVQNKLAHWFAPLGETARANDVRVSFHPDQFVVLASDREEVVNKSIEEFEYHASMARWMGYGLTFQDFKINVHISGRQGPEGIRKAYNHWVREGVYIDPASDSVKRVVDSWRGVRPACHYSVSREDILVGHDLNVLPDMATLLEQGHKKQKLRAHSDYYWNKACNEWALSFNEQFDIMCESKAKNLASFALFEESKNVRQNKEIILEEACA